MPLYEYRCDACGHVFERIQKFSDPPVEVCPNCGERKVQKLLSSPAIQFKGSGWYITDYARKGSGSDAPATGGDGSGKSSSSESKAADSKAADTKSSESKGGSSGSTSGSSSSGSTGGTPASKD
jgi:putative FmdB family regulatory protein